MALSLDVRRKVPAALRTLLEREFDQSLRRLEQAAGDKPADRVEGVHEYRRSVKRLRAALQLASGVVPAAELHGIDRALSDAARRLGTLRDAHARRIAAERVAMLLPKVWRALAMDAWRSSGGMVTEAAADLPQASVQSLLQASRSDMQAIRVRVQALKLDAIRAQTVADAVADAWRRARTRFNASWEDRDEAWLHGARKRAQRAANLLVLVGGWGGRWSAATERRLRRASGLLGEARDSELMLERMPAVAPDAPLHEVVRRLREVAMKRRKAALRESQREGRAALRLGRGACRKRLMSAIDRAP
jgi:CHAD domain-containing protein